MTPGGRHCFYHPAQPLAELLPTELLPIAQLRHHPRDAGIAGKPAYAGQVVQGGYAWETARTGNFNPVVKDRRADMVAKVAVRPVQHGIDQRFQPGFLGYRFKPAEFAVRAQGFPSPPASGLLMVAYGFVPVRQYHYLGLVCH